MLLWEATAMNFNELFESTYNQNLHHEPRKFVELYDHNRILIEGQNISASDIIYDRVTQFTSDYAHSLVHNESHTKAKPEIDKAIRLFENHPDYNEEELLDIKYYETLIFDRSVVNYYAKNYKEAIEDLSILTNKFPNDEKFRNWLRAAKSYKLMRFEKVLYMFLIAALIADVFLESSNPILDIVITGVLAISLITIGGIELIKWKQKKST